MNTAKETIGPRGTVPGYRPLIGGERWHKETFTAWLLEGGYRPLLASEYAVPGDEWRHHSAIEWARQGIRSARAASDWDNAIHRTTRPLPPPQVETFEAHGHVWYRHVPGDACPVEADAIVALKFMEGGCTYSSAKASILKWGGSESYTVIGYRFPDFPAVHTPAQQEQHVEKTMQSFQHDTAKQRLATMYHGWCDVAPDSVAECIADVARVLYPTDAERCEAAFEAWKKRELGVSAVTDWSRKKAWDAAWIAAKQEKP